MLEKECKPVRVDAGIIKQGVGKAARLRFIDKMDFPSHLKVGLLSTASLLDVASALPVEWY